MKEKTEPSPTKENGDPAGTTAAEPERSTVIRPLILTPPPIPWEELDNRHHASAKVS